MTYHPVFTAGYLGHRVADLEQAVLELGALVVDIRHVPHSRVPEWDGEALAARLGDNYRRLPHWGNVNKGTGKAIELVNPVGGLMRVLCWAKERPLILLCCCQNFAECHRSVCAALLAPYPIEVRELSWPAPLGAAGAVKCIALWQPHASLIFAPEGARKIYETRSWPTSYRGLLAIHAAKSNQDLWLCGTGRFRETLRAMGLVSEDGELRLPLGAVLGVVELVDCIPTGGWCKTLPEPARTFGDFSPKRFAWKLANPRLFPVPVPARGYQGLWDLEIDLAAALAGTLPQPAQPVQGVAPPAKPEPEAAREPAAAEQPGLF